MVQLMKNKNTTTMKKSVLFFAVLFILTAGIFAQNTYNVVIFSEDGEPFYAFVNGIRQNDKPETNIRVTDLNSEALNLRVEFENKALPKLKQNVMPEPGYEHTINIRRNMKKELKMTYFGKVALADAPKGSATNIAYHTSENAIDNGTSNTSTTNADYSNSTGLNMGNGGVSVTTSTQISTNPNNISINMGGNGINVNMTGNGVQNSTTTTVTTTSSTGYSSSSSTSGSTSNYSTGGTRNSSTGQSTGNYSGCSVAMSPSAYDKMKQSVEEKPFSDTKMSTAKIATKNNCLSSAQIKGICQLFSMDDDKLAYAKYAYDYCVDKGNYYTVSEIFSFSTTTDSFNKFLESK
jgi:hypothetical protein